VKVLIACEFSGIVRDAFIQRGHNAMSCDLLPTESPGSHYQGDVMDILCDGWDMMIAFPPCTYLSYAGTAYWNDPGRCKSRLEALDFFRRLWEAPIQKICIENPKGCASPTIAKYTQEIQPYYFGDAYFKTTWLWLKSLPPLQYVLFENLFETKTSVDRPTPIYTDKSGKKRYFTDAITGMNGGNHKRSCTFKAIAEAMADQWG